MKRLGEFTPEGPLGEQMADVSQIGPSKGNILKPAILVAVLAAGGISGTNDKPASANAGIPNVMTLKTPIKDPPLTQKSKSHHSTATKSGKINWVPYRGGRRTLGIAVSKKHSESSDYLRAVGKFSSVTPENEGKLHWLVKDRNKPTDFGGLDWVIGLARHNRQRVHGHTLVFKGAENNPRWLNQEARSCRTTPDILGIGRAAKKRVNDFKLNYINQVINHDPNILELDVVNEPFTTDGRVKSDIWSDCTDPDHLYKIFEAAHEANPNVILFVNEIHAEKPGPKQDALFNLAKRLKRHGFPVGIGFQAHVAPDFNIKEFEKTLKRFAALGVTLRITELDIDLSKAPSSDDFRRQARLFLSFGKACVQQSYCSGISTWGTDATSWTGNYGTLIDSDYQPKKVFYQLRALLNGPKSK